MCFSRNFLLFLRPKETTLIKFSLLCESSVKFSPNCKSLASNNEAILSY